MRKRRGGEAVIIEGMQELPYVESGLPAAIWLGVPLMMHGRTTKNGFSRSIRRR